MSLDRVTRFSADRKYRYTLWRDWSCRMTEQPLVHFTEDPHLDYYLGDRKSFVQFVGLNPSTADETQDDPTIRRCIGFAQSWGFGAMCMTNLFAWRETDSSKLAKVQHPFGPANTNWLCAVAEDAGLTVAVWGAKGGLHNGDKIAAAQIPKLHYLKLTKDGHPHHPLRLPKTLTPIPFK